MEASGANLDSTILTKSPLDTLKSKIHLLLPLFLLHDQNYDVLTDKQNRARIKRALSGLQNLFIE